MLNLTGLQKQVLPQQLLVSDDEQQNELGQIGIDQYGNTYKYCKNLEALTRGKIAKADDPIGVDTVSSSNDGSGDTVYITEGSAGWTNNAYAGYVVHVDDGTGQGQTRRVKSNNTDTLTLEDELSTALSVTDSDITLVSDVHTNASEVDTLIQDVVGIAVGTVASDEYAWLQIGGLAEVIFTAAPTQNEYATPGGATTTGQAVNAGADETIDDVTIIGRTVIPNAGANKASVVKLLNLM